MSLQEEIARNMLRAAMQSENGLRVKIEATEVTSMPTLRAKQILYRYKNENADYKILQIRLDNIDPDNFLLIIKSNEPDPETLLPAVSEQDFDL